jgi:hypothetical protein
VEAQLWYVGRLIPGFQVTLARTGNLNYFATPTRQGEADSKGKMGTLTMGQPAIWLRSACYTTLDDMCRAPRALVSQSPINWIKPRCEIMYPFQTGSWIQLSCLSRLRAWALATLLQGPLSLLLHMRSDENRIIRMTKAIHYQPSQA